MTSIREPFSAISIRICSDKAAFEARTIERLSLKMNEVSNIIGQLDGHEILAVTPHMMIFRCGNAEATLSKDGRMLIKKVANEAEARLVARQILSVILKQVK